MVIISVILALFFTFASSIKITGWQTFIFETQLRFFKKYGLTRAHMLLVGLVELSASILLVASIFNDNYFLNVIGGLGIAFTSIVAVFFHFRFDTYKDALPAMVTLLLSTVLIMLNLAVYA